MAIKQLEVQDILEVLQDAIAERKTDRVRDVLRQASPDDAARALDALTPLQLATIVTLLGDEQLADLLENFERFDAARLLLKLSRSQAADVLEEMDPDDAVDVVEELGPSAEAILIEMEAPEAEDIRELMAYPPESAAGLMTKEVVTLSPDLTAEQALLAIRRVAQEAETIYYVYVTDHTGKLLGVLALRDLVLAAPNTPISQLTRRDLVKVRADADQEVAARLLTDRGLLAIPVVDENDRLLGIITSDDVADVLEEEATEDITRLGGSEPLDEPYLRSSILTLVQKRVIWLLVLFAGGTLTANVLSHHQATLDQVVALQIFIPLLIGTGGNVGSQIVTTVVRAMGVGEVRLQDLARVLRKELAVGALIGTIMAAAAFAQSWILGIEWHVGMVVAVTACLIVLWTATVSAILPPILRRVGVDPAVVSAPFITTLVDATGLLLYLNIARAILGIR
jgi:magnesium transporter